MRQREGNAKSGKICLVFTFALNHMLEYISAQREMVITKQQKE